MPTTILDGETYEQARHRRFTEEAKVIEKMQQDEIIRMAQEAGFDIGGDGLHAYHPDTRDELPLDTYLEHFAALVAAHEREACAKVCEEVGPKEGSLKLVSEGFAEAIRSRNEK